MADRVGGEIQVKQDSVLLSAKGEFTYNLGTRKKTMVAGVDGIHGYKDETVVPFIDGIITDNSQLDVKALQEVNNATITLLLANGKTIALREAVYAADADQTTNEGEIPVRYEGISAEEV